MPTISNIKTELTATLLAMTENLQYNQPNGVNSFDGFLQREVSSNLIKPEDRQTSSGNRQENSFEHDKEVIARNVEEGESLKSTDQINVNEEAELSDVHKFHEMVTSDKKFSLNKTIDPCDHEDPLEEKEDLQEANEMLLLVHSSQAQIINTPASELENIRDEGDRPLEEEPMVVVVEEGRPAIITLPQEVKTKMNDEEPLIDGSLSRAVTRENTIEQAQVIRDENTKLSYLEEIGNQEISYNKSLVEAPVFKEQSKEILSPDVSMTEIKKQEQITPTIKQSAVLEQTPENISIDVEYENTEEVKNKNKSSRFQEIITELEQKTPVKTVEVNSGTYKAQVFSEVETNLDPENQLSVKNYRQINQQVSRYAKSINSEKGALSITSDYVEHSVFDNKWGKYFGEKLLQLSLQGTKQAILHIEPPDLGPIDVHIELDNDKTQISFASNHAPVRDALENSSTKLKELFSQQGLPSLEVNISDKESAQQPFSDRTLRQAKYLPAGSAPIERAAYQYSPQGLIDYFA